jgi:hypothetical protein
VLSYSIPRLVREPFESDLLFVGAWLCHVRSQNGGELPTTNEHGRTWADDAADAAATTAAAAATAATTPATKFECICPDPKPNLPDLEPADGSFEWLASWSANPGAHGADIQSVSSVESARCIWLAFVTIS